MIAYEKMKPYYYENKDVSDAVKLPYRMYVPETYDSNKKYKVLFFMHGMGERGSDNEHLKGEDYHRYLCYVLEDEKLREEFILVAPQCEKSCCWVNYDAMVSYAHGDEVSENACSDALALVYDFIENKLAKEYSIDGSRIYMTGLSMGGFATWYTLINKPNLLAAAVPVCGGPEPQKLHQAKHTPIWAFHSLDDDIVPAICLSRTVEIAEKENFAEFHGTMYEHEGHGSWVRAYLERDVFDWMLSKVNPNPQIK